MSTTAEPARAVPGTGSAVWLHGVVAAVTATPAGTTGIAGTPVRSVAGAGLVAVVSDVPLAEYGEEALRRNLEDLAWLERAARAHHAVVAALCGAGPVVPARLATVHRDDDRVARVLAERHDELAGTLARLTGREEWGVKGYVVPGATPRTEEPAAGGGAGAAYLRRRKAQLTAREEGQRIAADAAAAVHAALAGYAVTARRHAPQDRRLSGAPTAMVLNGAYLIDRERLDGFAALVRELADRHPEIRLEATGPWPPYSFVAEPSAEPAWA
ncbi:MULTISPECIES: GvpL/GvpF family gas vesicle protein [Micromonospora]|uniref:Gas vesicle protein GvpFL n=1 Tax=Micromonospora solifontis TaxID=2487138 RepID=A0ABX9WE07_9ACTN|nr:MULTISPECIES: GvpL/GvpF family gas vesicle protein [Micromonospora]NES16737.1 GvpL/GvpF family gas vesicle protein [Micromonospora sp. PPF5-17B]NES37695.1 GvpL/GvpF family gas vesicle protein [Micromonospora solifontis]NES58433.1 GvpL/GvpF family gas vesicle protein [Micromonospora sp. PPF5-6]RNL98042.1 gas vesicle protein GvpFL [Micromonospora solifontis]